MFKQTLIAVVLGAPFLLTACGGGSGSSPSSSSNTTTTKSVTGPLDPVQTTLSDSVVAPLANAVAGTPLEDVANCADAVVVNGVLDLGDTALNQIQDGAANPDPTALADNVQALAGSLAGYLLALADSGDGCLSPDAALALISADALSGTNPLDGGPLAGLGSNLIPALADVQTALTNAGSGGLSADQASALINRLASAFGLGIDQIQSLSPSTLGLPVLGGSLTSTDDALAALSTLFNSVAANDPTGATANLSALLDTVVTSLAGTLVPLDGFDPNGDLLAQISSGSAVLSSTLSSLAGQTSDGALSSLLSSDLTSALSPLTDATGGTSNLSTITDLISGDLGGASLSSLLDVLTTADTLTSLLGTSAGGCTLGIDLGLICI